MKRDSVLTPQSYRHAAANLENHGVISDGDGFVQALAIRHLSRPSLGVLVVWDPSHSTIILRRYADLPAAVRVLRALEQASTPIERERAFCSEPEIAELERVTEGLPDLLKPH